MGMRLDGLVSQYGVACSKSGDVLLQRTCGRFDSSRLHKNILVSTGLRNKDVFICEAFHKPGLLLVKDFTMSINTLDRMRLIN